MENKEEEREKELWDWLRKDERFYSAVDIFNFPETGRGLKALRDINVQLFQFLYPINN